MLTSSCLHRQAARSANLTLNIIYVILKQEQQFHLATYGVHMSFRVRVVHIEASIRRTMDGWRKYQEQFELKHGIGAVHPPTRVDLGIVKLSTRQEVKRHLEAEGYSKDEYRYIIQNVAEKEA